MQDKIKSALLVSAIACMGIWVLSIIVASFTSNPAIAMAGITYLVGMFVSALALDAVSSLTRYQ